jgi:hypothetical protein
MSAAITCAPPLHLQRITLLRLQWTYLPLRLQWTGVEPTSKLEAAPLLAHRCCPIRAHKLIGFHPMRDVTGGTHFVYRYKLLPRNLTSGPLTDKLAGEMKTRMLGCERILLQQLQFDLGIELEDHPFHFLIKSVLMCSFSPFLFLLREGAQVISFLHAVGGLPCLVSASKFVSFGEGGWSFRTPFEPRHSALVLSLNTVELCCMFSPQVCSCDHDQQSCSDGK